jgi:anti-anti-sigma factor
MEISIAHSEDNIAVLSLTGSLLTEGEGVALMDAFQHEVQNGYTRMVLELQGLKHVNSAGLGVFIRLLTRVRTAGGELVVCGISPGISSLFTITKLHTIFRIAEDATAAQKLLSA